MDWELVLLRGASSVWPVATGTCHRNFFPLPADCTPSGPLGGGVRTPAAPGPEPDRAHVRGLRRRRPARPGRQRGMESRVDPGPALRSALPHNGSWRSGTYQPQCQPMAQSFCFGKAGLTTIKFEPFQAELFDTPHNSVKHKVSCIMHWQVFMDEVWNGRRCSGVCLKRVFFSTTHNALCFSPFAVFCGINNFLWARQC